MFFKSGLNAGSAVVRIAVFTAMQTCIVLPDVYALDAPASRALVIILLCFYLASGKILNPAFIDAARVPNVVPG